jgi:tetratricopeptide (TPR) repeat protein
MHAALLVLMVLAAPSGTLSRQHFERARRWFAQHDYRHALDEFTAAAELAPTELPDLWFDIAQCHRHLGHSRQAVLAYDHYLALAPDAGDRAKVVALMTQLGGHPVESAVEPVSAREPPPLREPPPRDLPAPAPPPAAAAPEPPPPPVALAAPSLASDAIDRAPAPPPPRPRRRWITWTAVAGGVALTAVAVGLGVGLSLDHAAAPTPMTMLGSAGTFDTRGR